MIAESRYLTGIGSSCGYVSSESRRSQSTFVCVACGHWENADVNAAKNILRAGQALSVCGEGPLGPSVKQKPRAPRKGRSQAANAA